MVKGRDRREHVPTQPVVIRAAASPETPRKRLKIAEEEVPCTPSDAVKGASYTPKITPSKSESKLQSTGMSQRTIFASSIVVSPAVRHVYSVVNKSTGALGGNGSFGAIYGELSEGSMQRVVNVLRAEAELDASSRFIDVGSGLGKPSLHVSQDPGCQLSFGIELELVRWQLSIHNHRSLLLTEPPEGGNRPSNVYFMHGDMQQAKTFDPFTHVYMFDLGFPPSTFSVLAKAFNRSMTPYLISYQQPRKVIDLYGFGVELIHKEGSLQLTGSSENHTMYVYRRKDGKLPKRRLEFTPPGSDWRRHVDPLFKQGVKLVCAEDDGASLTAEVQSHFSAFIESGRQLRSRS
jgi:hypothetical protein